MPSAILIRGSFTIEPPLTPEEISQLEIDLPECWIARGDRKGDMIVAADVQEVTDIDTIDAIVPILNRLREHHAVSGRANVEGYDDCGDYVIGFSKVNGEFVDNLDVAAEEGCERQNHLANMQASLMAYRDERLKPGGFLTAILENDLQAACDKADRLNRHNIFELVWWAWNELPANCWGSRDKVRAWLGKEPE